MTPQSCCRSTVLTLYGGAAACSAVIVAAFVAWLVAGMRPGSLWVFLPVFVALLIAAVPPGVWLAAEVDRQWERLDSARGV